MDTKLPVDDDIGDTENSNPSIEPLDRRDTDPSSGSLEALDRKSTDPSRERKRAKTALSRPSQAVPAPRGVKDEHVSKTFGGKYRIDKLIAKGGMGRVYLATQFPLERPVAVKVLNREFQQSDPQFVKRFFLEASIAAQLSHPHTITVFDYGESDTNDLYIAMEYLKGRPLSRILRTDGPFDPLETLRLTMQICRALRSAHSKGIIHRDLKPGNIFILEEGEEAGYAKVLDFGLVKLFTPEGDDKGNAFGASMLGDGDVELTRTGTLLGSPKYMSPEQIQGLKLDPRTDIYSFGIILFQMISGKAPFTGATGVDVIYKHVNFPVPPIRTVNPHVECPPELEAIARKCLEKRREDRFPSMDALIDALKEAQRTLTGSVGNDSISDLSRSKSMKVGGSASASRSRPAEVNFREPIEEEVTPPGGLVDPSKVVTKTLQPSKWPIAVAGSGFVIALLALLYVFTMAPQPSHEPTPTPSAAIAPPSPPPIAAPAPPPPLPQNVVEPPPPLVEPPPAVAPVPAKSKQKKRKKPKRPRNKKNNRVDAPEPPAKVDLPPNYRENPY